ncbi:MAG: hypothetical protein ACT4N9_05320 [Paracoccaceae bacterium]
MALFGHDNPHSRAVALLKIALPLVGLAILSTLFLVSTARVPDDLVPYADVDIADLLREPRLTGPSYAGVTRDGAVVTLSAREALPGEPGTSLGGLARDLKGVLETPDGVRSTFSAGEARLDVSEDLVLLLGGVTISISTGTTLSFEEGQIALDRTSILAFGGISATGPMGRLRAGILSIAPAKDSPGHTQMVFKGGVRLLYQP